MCEYIKHLLNLLWIKYLEKNYLDYETQNTIFYNDNFICPICSCNMSNTICYESECVNFGQKILF